MERLLLLLLCSQTLTRLASACEEFTVKLYDSANDGWQGNFLHIGDDVSSTLEDGGFLEVSICLPPGTYLPNACGGPYPSEVTWEIYGAAGLLIGGGADALCLPTSGNFTVFNPPTPSPTLTSAPTFSPAPTLAPSPLQVSLPPTPAPTFVPSVDATATTEAEIRAALASNTRIHLSADVVLHDNTLAIGDPSVGGQTGVVINGNGHTLDGNGTFRCILIGPGSEVALNDLIITRGAPVRRDRT
jgi:hypothetical protein